MTLEKAARRLQMHDLRDQRRHRLVILGALARKAVKQVPRHVDAVIGAGAQQRHVLQRRHALAHQLEHVARERFDARLDRIDTGARHRVHLLFAQIRLHLVEQARAALAARERGQDGLVEAGRHDVVREMDRIDTPARLEITHFVEHTILGLIREDMEGKYDITNLGAILFAADIEAFPSIARKSVRVIRYIGKDKRASSGEIEGKRGYAAGFARLMSYIKKALPTEEVYNNGVRTTQAVYPETAIREVIANALIHQDFTFAGAGPVVEMYADRIEVTNPGHSLIEVDRLIDERRSRNEKLAATIRSLGLCEERGGGLDKAIIEIELKNLPAPNFISSENSMRVVLFGPKDFSELSKEEKLRACFFHCVLCWIKNDYMNNTTLRNRFGLEQDEYQSVSTIISECVKKKRIIPADPNQGNRYAKYVPYWVR
jgi:ATP-dependent DNA helicase recG-like protein